MSLIKALHTNELQIHLEVMNTLIKAVEAKDPYTAGHVWRVSQYAKMIAKKLDWDREKLDWIEAGAMLHDLGKIGVGDAVLNKNGRLSHSELIEMQKHPVIGVHLIDSSTFLMKYQNCILTHHERFDGKGYPHGLMGEEIPIEGRIIAVADTFDALTSHRPYRGAMNTVDAIRIIEEQSGTQFDPQIVDVFVKLWWETHFNGIILHSSSGIPLVKCPAHGEIIERSPHAMPGGEAYCSACKMSFQLVMHDGEWNVIMQ
jgi:HD-GYP domain-containing protein (c-di-GMP phosphodiesterase class II)